MTQENRVAVFGWADSEHIQRWLKGLSSRGYLPKLVSLGGEPIQGVDSTVFPFGGKAFYAIRAPQAALLARRFRPDLLHVHYAYGFGIWGLLSRIRPMIVSVWGSEIRDSATSKLTHAVVHRVLTQATWITATSHFLAEETLKLFPEVEKKLSIIPFGVDVPATCPEPPAHRDAVRLCFIKVHRPNYGPDLLIQAMEKVVKSNSRVELSIAGQGEMTDILKQMVVSRRLERHVRFVGYIPNYRIYPFIQEHDIMVMPSLSESFGVAAVEAGACGRPVIASRVGGIPEVILNGRSGLLLPPGEVDALVSAILTLANDGVMRQSMGQAGYEYVRDNYNWDKSLDQMAQLYERLIDEHKKSHTSL